MNNIRAESTPHYNTPPIWTILSCLILLLVFGHYSYISARTVQGWYNSHRARNIKIAMDWIKSNTDPDDVIISDWVNSQVITANTGRGIIASSKVLPSEAKMVAERYNDISAFFCSKNPKEALFYIDKYSIDYVLLFKNRYDRLKPRNDREKARKIFKGNSLTAYGIENTLVGAFADRKDPPMFKRVVDTSTCALFKIRKNYK